MAIDFDKVINRKGTHSLKYDFATVRGKKADILPLWVADMDFQAPKAVRERLFEIVEHGIFGYSDTLEDYFREVKSWYKRRFDWEIESDWIIKTPGIVFALAMAVKAYTEPGESVLMLQPVYYPFREVIEDNGRKLIGSPLKLEDLGLDTGALAKIEGKEPGGVVAIRADIDALPILEESGLSYSSENDGCMHACGHDFHTTALLGVAKLLGGEREHIKGTVILLFQPAEEAEHGGEKVVNTGMFEKYKIEKIFGLHTKQNMPVGTIAIAPGPFSAAVDRFLYTVKGMGCHGSAPQTGLDPIPAAARLVGSLQEIVSRRISPTETAVISVTRFTSGTSWNIIPETARLEGTVRTFNPKVREQIVELMQAQAEGLEREGYQVEFTWIPGCPATNNDANLAELVRKEAVEEGFHVTLQHPEMGGEDFSCYQELVPGAFFHVGTGGKYPAHNSKFTVDPAALLGASKLMSEIVKKALKAS